MQFGKAVPNEIGEIIAKGWVRSGPVLIGITAGASCLNNLIEETLLRLFELRGITHAQLELAP